MVTRHVAFMLTSLAPAGGIERDAVKCIKELANSNFHIHLIVAFPHKEMIDTLSTLPISWYPVDTFLRPPAIGQMLFCLKTNRILKKIRHQFGNMECVSFENHPPASILIGSTSQALWNKARIQGGMGRSLRPLWNAWKSYSEKKCLLNAKKIAVYSEQVRQIFIALGTSPEKLSRLIIPADTNFFTPKNTPPLHERRELLIIGANPKLKGIDIALTAWKQLADEWPDMSLRVVTKGWKVKALIKKIGAPRVITSPFITDPRAYYNSARLVITPSIFESWGNVVVEALSSGIPVVASSQVPSSELMQEQEHGVSFTRDGTKDHLKLVNAMRQALRDTSEQTQCMKARHQHVLEFQSSNSTMTSWLVSQLTSTGQPPS